MHDQCMTTHTPMNFSLCIVQASNPNRSIPGRLRNLFGLRSARTGDTEIHEEEAEDSAKVGIVHL